MAAILFLPQSRAVPQRADVEIKAVAARFGPDYTPIAGQGISSMLGVYRYFGGAGMHVAGPINWILFVGGMYQRRFSR
jgi:hypothetical protein